MKTKEKTLSDPDRPSAIVKDQQRLSKPRDPRRLIKTSKTLKDSQKLYGNQALD